MLEDDVGANENDAAAAGTAMIGFSVIMSLSLPFSQSVGGLFVAEPEASEPLAPLAGFVRAAVAAPPAPPPKRLPESSRLAEEEEASTMNLALSEERKECA
jgi:hypothetical protein